MLHPFGDSELRIPKLNLASDFFCMEARAVSKILLGTIGMSWTVQRCMRRQMSMITVISSHTFWALAASHSSVW